MKLKPYWIDTATPFARGETGPVEGEVDVAVVGAGFTGLWTALEGQAGGRRLGVDISD